MDPQQQTKLKFNYQQLEANALFNIGNCFYVRGK